MWTLLLSIGTHNCRLVLTTTFIIPCSLQLPLLPDKWLPASCPGQRDDGVMQRQSLPYTLSICPLFLSPLHLAHSWWTLFKYCVAGVQKVTSIFPNSDCTSLIHGVSPFLYKVLVNFHMQIFFVQKMEFQRLKGLLTDVGKLRHQISQLCLAGIKMHTAGSCSRYPAHFCHWSPASQSRGQFRRIMSMRVLSLHSPTYQTHGWDAGKRVRLPVPGLSPGLTNGLPLLT